MASEWVAGLQSKSYPGAEFVSNSTLLTWQLNNKFGAFPFF